MRMPAHPSLLALAVAALLAPAAAPAQSLPSHPQVGQRIASSSWIGGSATAYRRGWWRPDHPVK